MRKAFLPSIQLQVQVHQVKRLSNSLDKTKVIDERDERKWQRLAIIIAIDERDERKWQRLAIIIAECKHSSSSFSLGSARGITFSRVLHLILLFVGFSELYADPIYICFLSMCSRCWL